MDAPKQPVAAGAPGAPGGRVRRRWWHRTLRVLLPRRFVVADRSMEPALVAGQGLLAWWSTTAVPGQIRCLPHPTRPDFWLVKRVAAVHHGDDGGSTMTVLSDNRDATVADSRSFGPVPVAGSYRVVIRIPHRVM